MSGREFKNLRDMKPRITVIGVGGAGCNAVNNMIAAGLPGVEFIAANTDAQSLIASSAEHRIQLGVQLTEGLGAGSRPEIGQAAAEEALADIQGMLAGSHMVFVAAGMGGGTGTGAAGVIARTARDLGALTVGIVTKPFHFEGSRRMRLAEAGIAELKKYVDTLIVIPNQNLFRIANERTTFAEAFVLADQVLYSGVACIVDLVLKEGLINLDFADVRTVMSDMGSAMMGTGEATGARRAILAAEEAIANPLLDDVSLKGAKGLLLSITGGRDLTLYEVDEAATRVRQEVDPDANIIVGATYDENLGDRVRVSIVASGMARANELPRPANAATAQPPTVRSVEIQPPPIMHGLTPPPLKQHPQPSTPLDGRIMQRRLAEAIDPQSGSNNGQQPPAKVEGQPSMHAHARTVWQGPDSVTIEEGLPPLIAEGLKSRTPRQSQGSASGFPHQVVQSNGAAWPDSTFQPARPQEIRRTSSNIPSIEEFPPVAQKEWNSRVQSGLPVPAEGSVADAPRKRTSLFERFAQLGRRPEQEHPGVDRAEIGQKTGSEG